MKVLLINGSPNEFGCTYTALREVADTLEKEGVGTEILYLGKKPVGAAGVPAPEYEPRIATHFIMD